MTDVKRKEFVDYLEIKGEVRAIRSAVIAAPYGAGDLQILRLVDNATKVKKGDFLVEFDATTVKQKLAEDQSAVKSAEAEIQQSRAASRLKEEQDVTDEMTAKYDTEKARMDASKQEILSVIEGEQAKLKLADAEQKQKETEAKLKADRGSAASDRARKQHKHDKAAFQVELDQRALDSLTLRAPLDGVVALVEVTLGLHLRRAELGPGQLGQLGHARLERLGAQGLERRRQPLLGVVDRGEPLGRHRPLVLELGARPDQLALELAGARRLARERPQPRANRGEHDAGAGNQTDQQPERVHDLALSMARGSDGTNRPHTEWFWLQESSQWQTTGYAGG